eukprot:TRINITY_DN11072_c0_g1_i2.p1 TRINITY_DN11072_c0_g1~~TRINITY_DN11072_c0_g1_i2.p1  ORF type:complete len:176 (-),score=32.59 TRINITY_DN11072_c0_g1_i2:142-669(-)
MEPTLAEWKNNLGALYDQAKGNFEENKLDEELDRRGFTNDAVRRSILKKELRSDGFFSVPGISPFPFHFLFSSLYFLVKRTLYNSILDFSQSSDPGDKLDIGQMMALAFENARSGCKERGTKERESNNEQKVLEAGGGEGTGVLLGGRAHRASVGGFSSRQMAHRRGYKLLDTTL